MFAAVNELEPVIGIKPACELLGVKRATLYRRRSPQPTRPRTPRRPSPRALSEPERKQVLDVLHSERFSDVAPGEVVATLLDEGTYLASERTMYRILAAQGESRERRNQLVHPAHRRPELLATKPNQLWTWDITKLLGPAKWTYYYLYVILDVFSRYAVGWMIAERELAVLAQRLIKETIAKQTVESNKLTIHADRGSSMTSKPVALLLADLGVTKSHSRPHVSNDNCYSESQFKTLKYHPGFPDRFGSIQDARAFCVPFFDWYNRAHRHSGIGMMTPEAMHYGWAKELQSRRAAVLRGAYERHPERFPRGVPRPWKLPTAAWINPEGCIYWVTPPELGLCASANECRRPSRREHTGRWSRSWSDSQL